MWGGSGTCVEQQRPSIVMDSRTGSFFVIGGVFVVVIHNQYWKDKEGRWGVQLVKQVGVIFRELECVYFVNSIRHSCSLVGELIKGCIALRSIFTFVFAVIDDVNELVLILAGAVCNICVKILCFCLCRYLEVPKPAKALYLHKSTSRSPGFKPWMLCLWY